MIQVKTNDGWQPYCDVGILSNITDMNGAQLNTGDTVDVINRAYHEAGLDGNIACPGMMIIFDQHENFLKNKNFFVEGWLSYDWLDPDDNNDFVIRKSKTHDSDCNYRIVETDNEDT